MSADCGFWTGGADAFEVGLQQEKKRLEQELKSLESGELRAELEEQLRTIEAQINAPVSWWSKLIF